jgi:class 3 adenylate cyclase
MKFRIGVNLGDIIHDDARVYGDGVNVAARLEGVAEPGGICISVAAYDQVPYKAAAHVHRSRLAVCKEHIAGWLPHWVNSVA